MRIINRPKQQAYRQDCFHCGSTLMYTIYDTWEDGCGRKMKCLACRAYIFADFKNPTGEHSADDNPTD